MTAQPSSRLYALLMFYISLVSLRLAHVHLLYGVMKMDGDALLRNEKLLEGVIVTRREFLWGAWRTKKLILPLSCRKG